MKNQIIVRQRIVTKFLQGTKMVKKYLPYKQEVISFEQQKWVGPYTITIIHDDDTLQIKNISQRDFGQ